MQNEGERFGSICYMIAVNIYLGRQRREGGKSLNKLEVFSCCVCPNSEVECLQSGKHTTGRERDEMHSFS